MSSDVSDVELQLAHVVPSLTTQNTHKTPTKQNQTKQTNKNRKTSCNSSCNSLSKKQNVKVN